MSLFFSTYLRFSVLLILVFAVAVPDRAEAQSLTVRDLALKTNVQDTVLGHFKRGRACIGADFDLDGYIDFYLGNPGDESYILHNVPRGNGRTFEPGQMLVIDERTWGGVSFDYDNDGDYDLFISVGGNEGVGYDIFFRNDYILDGTVTGNLVFTDVTDIAGVRGPIPAGGGQGARSASANAVTADYDQDGDTDMFVNGNNYSIDGHPELVGRNTLWRNNGNGTFTDVTDQSGLGVTKYATRHSTFLDYDNDGDADLYENNFEGPQFLWRNNGDGTFTDVTADAAAPGNDLSYPFRSFVSAAADFNNDGWEDIMVMVRGNDSQSTRGNRMAGGEDCGSCAACPVVFPEGDPIGESLTPYPDGHAIFLNQGDGTFDYIADETTMNNTFISKIGVMGSMVGDISGDGIPDIYVGNGGPSSGTVDQLYVSVPGSEDALRYTDMSYLIDFPSVIPNGFPPPAYPYRTHGTTFIDMENDGQLEIMVINGGPISSPDLEVREPNRLFKILVRPEYNWLKVRPVGDGITIAKDAVGTRIAVTVSKDGADPQTIHRTLFAGSAFSAQNGFDVHFAIGDANTVESVDLVWPNGSQSTITEGVAVNSAIVIDYNAGMAMLKSVSQNSQVAEPPQDGPVVEVAQNYPNPFNPSTVIRYSLLQDSHVQIAVYDVLGKRVATLADEFQSAGERAVVWNGRTAEGSPVSSGLYFYRVRVGDHVESYRMLLTK